MPRIKIIDVRAGDEYRTALWPISTEDSYLRAIGKGDTWADALRDALSEIPGSRQGEVCLALHQMITEQLGVVEEAMGYALAVETR